MSSNNSNNSNNNIFTNYGDVRFRFNMSSTPSSTSGGGNNNDSSTAAAVAAASLIREDQMEKLTTARMSQLFDEQDHKRCSEGNRKALLAEKLEQLRGLVKVLEADEWKYTAPKSVYDFGSNNLLQQSAGSGNTGENCNNNDN
jgi:hypothetical protein